MSVSQKTLDKYIVELRRIEEHRTEGAEKQIRRIYKALLKDLNGFLGNEYTQYSNGEGELTVAILQEKREYTRFLEEVEKQLDDLTTSEAKAIRKTVEKTYEACYKGMVDAVENASDTAALAEAVQGSTMRPEVLKRAIENPVSGLTLPDVLEKNRKETIYKIKQEINLGLMNGDRYETVTRKVADRLDISYRKATTTVRTETHRVREGGFMDCAVDISEGVEGSGLVYVAIWHNMGDEKVRPQVRRKTKKGWKTTYSKNGANHIKMEGQAVIVGKEKFKFSDGVTTTAPSHSGVAAHDCNCRCFLEYKLMTVEDFVKLTGRDVKTASVHSSTKQMMNDNGIADLELQRNTDAAEFDTSIRAAIKSQPVGGCVDAHPIEELKDYKLFLAQNGMAGVAVKPDGDITAVFKNAEYKQRGAVNDLIITARANGGEKMDCYGIGLVNMYEKCGYTPVARVAFNADYVDDPYLLATRPDVYVLMKNTDSIEEVIEKNAAKAYKLSLQEELDNLPTYDYDEALSYRDELLRAQKS